MPVSVVRNGKTTTISVQGSFDADAVSRLRNVLRELRTADGREPNIVVDLRRARDVPPIALAALVEGGREMGIRYLGLSNHSARLLNHLTAAAPE
jgi:anti-anti-sigma regulatory factor